MCQASKGKNNPCRKEIKCPESTSISHIHPVPRGLRSNACEFSQHPPMDPLKQQLKWSRVKAVVLEAAAASLTPPGTRSSPYACPGQLRRDRTPSLLSAVTPWSFTGTLIQGVRPVLVRLHTAAEFDAIDHRVLLKTVSADARGDWKQFHLQLTAKSHMRCFLPSGWCFPYHLGATGL